MGGLRRLVLALALGALASCGGSEPRLSKSAFVKEANARCANLQNEQQDILADVLRDDGAAPTVDDLQVFAERFVPAARATFDDIDELRPPAVDQEQVDHILAEFREVLDLFNDATTDDDLAAALINPPTHPMTDAVIAASEYGLTSCSF